MAPRGVSYQVVLIETTGNQSYIFGTNKLRENVGASELVYQVGTRFVLEAVRDQGGPDLWDPVGRTVDRTRFLDPARHPGVAAGAAVEVLVASSGKAELLVGDPEVARAIVRAVTLRAQQEAPGVEVLGAVSDPLDWDAPGSLARGIAQAHQRHGEARASRPSAALRFFRLPIVAECTTSGLPAAELWPRPGARPGERPEERSAVSLAKLQASGDADFRLKRLLHESHPELRFVESLSALEKLGKQEARGELDWQAVIHADGNGLGEIFQHFDQYCTSGNDGYANDLRAFSLALDVCTEQAFRRALGKLPRVPRHGRKWEDTLLAVPLVVGGDDLTVVCDGRFAIEFTAAFLEAFEQETQQTDPAHFGGVVPRIARRALALPRLSACAGVAITKPHYPFHAAYELCEDLLSSAKQVKRQVLDNQDNPYPCSAFDFHVHLDASGSDLREIRSRLKPRGSQARLYARPYVVSTLPGDAAAPACGSGWIAARSFSGLCRQIEAVMEVDPVTRRRVFPNGQLHELRAGLFQGKTEANERLALVLGRYDSLTRLTPDPGSLFGTFPEIQPDGTVAQIEYSPLVDVLEAAELVQGV
mgnify:CR=1 FL=1